MKMGMAGENWDVFVGKNVTDCGILEFMNGYVFLLLAWQRASNLQPDIYE
jgi:hypothetical protein